MWKPSTIVQGLSEIAVEWHWSIEWHRINQGRSHRIEWIVILVAEDQQIIRVKGHVNFIKGIMFLGNHRIVRSRR